MKCPECKQPMLERAFEGRNGTRVTIDVCQECGGLWFDTHESPRLSPTGTLQLFRAVYGQRSSYHPRRSGSLSCPRGDMLNRPACPACSPSVCQARRVPCAVDCAC